MTSRIDDGFSKSEAALDSAEHGASDRNPREVKSRTIGQVLSQLDLEFPGISASKIRFLEERGLVHPSRTETGMIFRSRISEISGIVTHSPTRAKV